MEVFIFMNGSGEFLCKNGSKVYTSKNDIDRMLTYRTKNIAKRIKNDTHYWEYRNIDIDNFIIKKVELGFV